MKTYKNHPDNFILLAIKLSIFFMLSMIFLNTMKLGAKPINLRNVWDKITVSQKKVQQIYTSQIGIQEKPSNSGPDVEKYLRYVNLPKGNPWCAAFVCWVFGEAGVGNPRTGWSPSLFPSHRVIWQRDERGEVKGENRSGVPSASPPSLATGSWQLATPRDQGTKNKEQRLPPSPSPRMGDVFGLYFPEKGRIAHVGFIDEWDGNWMISVEGNTNVSGGREGDGVYRKRRLVRSVYRVARYIE